MAKTITLEYPDEVAANIALDDMTILNRERSTHRPKVVFEDADFPGIREKLNQRRIPNGAPVVP